MYIVRGKSAVKQNYVMMKELNSGGGEKKKTYAAVKTMGSTVDKTICGQISIFNASREPQIKWRRKNSILEPDTKRFSFCIKTVS